MFSLMRGFRLERYDSSNHDCYVVQVEREFNRIAPELSSLAVYGGTALGPQIGEMRRGVDVIVGTPGRIIDHIGQGNLNLVR